MNEPSFGIDNVSQGIIVLKRWVRSFGPTPYEAIPKVYRYRVSQCEFCMPPFNYRRICLVVYPLILPKNPVEIKDTDIICRHETCNETNWSMTIGCEDGSHVNLNCIWEWFTIHKDRIFDDYQSYIYAVKKWEE
jgi:hypothetical protein